MVIYSRVALAVIVFGLSVGQLSVRAQSLDLMHLKQNLDLPFNGGLVERDRIRFYGSEYHQTEIGIVFFDRGVLKFPASGRPAYATAAIKASAISYVNSIPGGGGSCVQQGLVQGLLFANLSTADRKVILYVGDGGGHCNGADQTQYLQKTLAVVKSQNFQRAQINAIGVLQLEAVGESFLRSLASSNGGSYVKITR